MILLREAGARQECTRGDKKGGKLTCDAQHHRVPSVVIGEYYRSAQRKAARFCRKGCATSLRLSSRNRRIGLKYWR